MFVKQWKCHIHTRQKKTVPLKQGLLLVRFIQNHKDVGVRGEHKYVRHEESINLKIIPALCVSLL